MDLQKINWKLFLKNPEGAKAEDFFRVFNSWIPNSPEVFVDVVDYQHVPEGPVTLLAGYHLDYVLDRTDKRLGLLYNHKHIMDGSNEDKLKTSFQSFIKACKRLEQDPIFAGNLKFDHSEILFLINDRAIAPNTKETLAQIQPLLQSTFKEILKGTDFSLHYEEMPKKRFQVSIKINSEFNFW